MRPDLLIDDLRQARRSLARDRGVALVLVLVLALGIGATTAIFSLVDGVLLRPLPFRDPDALFVVREVIPELRQIAPTLPANARHYLAWRRQAKSFESLAILDATEPSLTGLGEPERLEGARVSAGFFDLFGATAALGRTFAPGDDEPGRDRIVVLSDAFWRRRFGADPTVVGRRLMLDGESLEVVGILPPAFRLTRFDAAGQALTTGPFEVYRPWPLDEKRWGLLGDLNYTAFARLRRGTSAAQAEADLDVVQAGIAAQLTGVERVTLRASLRPLHDQIVGASRQGLWMLLAAVGGILLVACGNVSHLLLVRAAGRSRDAAVRAALGASPGRLARQSLVESLLVSAAGGLSGMVLAVALVRLLVSVAPADLPRLAEVSLDWRALLVCVLASLATGVVCGLGPAWRVRRAAPHDVLAQSSRASTDSRRAARVRQLLVGLEVASSTVVLVASGLLAASLLRLGSVPRGFDSTHVLTADLNLPEATYGGTERKAQFLGDLVARLAAVPGASASGFVTILPLRGEAWADAVALEGDERPVLERPVSWYRAIGGEYLRTLGTPIVKGRAIGERDRPRPVAVVSEATAKRLWPGADPIGQRFRRGNPGEPAFEVVGVAADVRSRLDHDPGLMIYVPYWRRGPASVSLVMRTIGEPAAAAAALKAAVWSLDPSLPIADVQTMRQIERRYLAERRFQVQLVALFAGVSLLLAGLGTYSATAFGVARRRTELGLRLALGARPAQIGGLVLRQGLQPVVLGLTVGLATALALGRALSGLLFGVTPRDPGVLAMVTGCVLASAVAACWLPSRRASRVDPSTSLRSD